MKETNPVRGNKILGILGVVSAAGYVAIFLSTPIPQHIHAFFAALIPIALAYFVSIRVINKLKVQPAASSTEEPSSQERHRLFLILGFALLFRLILFWIHPATTDDVFRYIWDGRLMVHGINPFAFPPIDDASLPLRDAYVYPLINHKHVVTIYPPLLQAGFMLSYWIGPNVYAFKVLPLLFDLGSIVVLLWLLRRFRRSASEVLIYAWNPLIVLEFSGSAHVDSLGVFFLLLFLALMIMGRWPWAAISLAASVLTKWVPLLLLPFIWQRLPFRKAAAFTLFFLGLLIAAYLPFLEAGPNLFAALNTFVSKWRFNASLFDLAFHTFQKIIPDAWLTFYAEARNLPTGHDAWPSYRIDLALHMAKALFAVLFLLLYVKLWRDGREQWRNRAETLIPIWFILFAALLMLSTTVHPWYLAWLIPFLVFFPIPAFFYLSVAILLSYHVLHDYYFQGIWQERLWIKMTLYGPFYLLLFMDGWRWWKGKQKDRFEKSPSTSIG